MGFFDKLFSGDEKPNEISKLNWINLENLKQLEEINAQSFSIPVVIFKHSTSCSVSRMALKNFEREFDISNSTIVLYFLDLLSFRAISNQIALDYQVVHQSPQLILIKNAVSVYNISHSDIDAQDLKNQI